jgi:hypothetical protein
MAVQRGSATLGRPGGLSPIEGQSQDVGELLVPLVRSCGVQTNQPTLGLDLLSPDGDLGIDGAPTSRSVSERRSASASAACPGQSGANRRGPAPTDHRSRRAYAAGSAREASRSRSARESLRVEGRRACRSRLRRGRGASRSAERSSLPARLAHRGCRSSGGGTPGADPARDRELPIARNRSWQPPAASGAIRTRPPSSACAVLLRMADDHESRAPRERNALAIRRERAIFANPDLGRAVYWVEQLSVYEPTPAAPMSMP